MAMQEEAEQPVQWRSLKWPDGARYDGLVLGQQQHMLGVMTFSNRDRYEGQWSNGMMDGYGVYVWNNGTIYRGDWLQGRMHGCGTRMFRGSDGTVKAVEGKFFADEYVGPIIPCGGQECLDAAVEADVAAHQARAYAVQDRRRAAGAVQPAGATSQATQQQALPPGLDAAAEQKLSSLVQQIALRHADHVKQQQRQQDRT